MRDDIEDIKKYIKSNFLTKKGKINSHIFRGSRKESTLKYVNKLKLMFCLPDDYNNSDVIWSVLLNEGKPFICNNENCEVVISSSKKYCSPKCTSSSGETKEKRRKASLSKYGTEHPMKSKLVKDKVKSTNLDRYGAICPLSNQDIRNKAVDTWTVNLGVSHPMKNTEIASKAAESNRNKSEDDKRKIRLKYIDTCMDRYNVDHPAKSDEIKDKIKRKNIDRLGVEYPFQSSEIQKKAKGTMINKYGVDNPSRVLEIVEKKTSNTRKKYGVDNTSQVHLEPILGILKDKGYWVCNFIKPKLTTSEICQYFYDRYGVTVSEVTILRYAKKHGLTIYSYKSKAEIEISNYISNELGFDVIVGSSKGVIIPNYCIDIYVPEKMVAIEFDGLYWHSDKEDKHYHLKKTKLCEDSGIKLLHIFENEWSDPVKREIWKSIIASKLGVTGRIYARKCKVVNITSKVSKKFIDENHIQGNCNAAIRIGLEYQGELVSVLTIGKSRFDKSLDYEILRFCSKKGYTVVGGFSKLLKYFLIAYSNPTVISYGNRRWCSLNSNLYRANGFELKKETAPNYFYTKGGNVYNRMNFQKYILRNRFKIFDEKLSEKENMKLNGYRIIYDCGNLVYVRK